MAAQVQDSFDLVLSVDNQKDGPECPGFCSNDDLGVGYVMAVRMFSEVGFEGVRYYGRVRQRDPDGDRIGIWHMRISRGSVVFVWDLFDRGPGNWFESDLLLNRVIGSVGLHHG